MKELQINPFERFNSDWALVTAGTPEHFNSMTISWGSMGTIWSRPVISVYVRPDRYTWQFLKEAETFTVSFYPASMREALGKMGTLSGRDLDKVKAAGLTPKVLPDGMTFEEAEETFVCRKLYFHTLDFDSCPEAARRIYQNGVQPHYLIMGEVLRDC